MDDLKTVERAHSTSESAAQISGAIAMAYDALQKGRVDDARHRAKHLLQTHPASPHLFLLAGETEFMSGDIGAALDFFERAIAMESDNARLYIRKAQLLLISGERLSARKAAAHAAQLPPETTEVCWQAASIHANSNDPMTAVELYRRALSHAGDSPPLLYALASSEFFTGDFSAADEHLARLLKLSPQFGHALYLRATLRRQSLERNHISDLKSRMRLGFRDKASQAACMYALAKELEDVGEDTHAFAFLSEGARLMRSTLSYNVESECRAIADVREASSAVAMARAKPGDEDDGAIFIVGMPRSGTTLVERMLACQDGPAPAGELLDFGNALAAAAQEVRGNAPEKSAAQAALDVDYQRLGAQYMRTARQAANGSRRFVDKMPVNYLYCGMILKALPNARIIHLARDPLDTCFAVYKTLFYNAYHFSYDLTEIAKYYVAYHETMQHWHRVIPGRILDIRYEDLVTSPDYHSLKIREWCGLPTGNASANDLHTLSSRPFSTASAAQVREPVHTRSVHRSRRHMKGMSPAIAVLRAAGIRID